MDSALDTYKPQFIVSAKESYLEFVFCSIAFFFLFEANSELLQVVKLRCTINDLYRTVDRGIDMWQFHTGG